MPASKMAFDWAKNNLTSASVPLRSRPWPSRRDTNWANWFQSRGGAVARADLEPRPARDIAGAARCAGGRRRVRGVVAQLAHQRVEERGLAPGDQVGDRPVGGEADGLLLVGQGALPGGTSQRRCQA